MQRVTYSIFQNLLWNVFVCMLLAVSASAAMNDSDFIRLCKKGSLQQVAEAIKNGENINARGSMVLPIKTDVILYQDGSTPLMAAALYNTNPEVITALIKSGADVNARS